MKSVIHVNFPSSPANNSIAFLFMVYFTILCEDFKLILAFTSETNTRRRRRIAYIGTALKYYEKFKLNIGVMMFVLRLLYDNYIHDRVREDDSVWFTGEGKDNKKHIFLLNIKRSRKKWKL